MDEVEERLALIIALKRKYGDSIEAILAYGSRQREELERLTHHAERCDEAAAALARVNEQLTAQALALSAARAAWRRSWRPGCRAN